MKLPILLPIFALTLFAANEYSNRRAPGFSLMDTHYQQHDPQDYHGKVILIDFMQTTCPTCNALADTLVQVKSKYGDKIVILSVVTSPDTFDTVNQFAAQHHAGWPILFDSGQVMMSYLKLTPGNLKVQFPHVFIVDGNGTIRDDFEGLEDPTALSAQIDTLLK
jgi:peroxiredoxin